MSALLGSSGVFNIIFDVVILLVPIPMLWTLKIGPKRKIGIYVIFTVGTMYEVTSNPRVALLIEIRWPAFSIAGLIVRLNYADSPDQTLNQPKILIFAYV